jgi:hypothetical protein
VREIKSGCRQKIAPPKEVKPHFLLQPHVAATLNRLGRATVAKYLSGTETMMRMNLRDNSSRRLARPSNPGQQRSEDKPRADTPGAVD